MKKPKIENYTIYIHLEERGNIDGTSERNACENWIKKERETRPNFKCSLNSIKAIRTKIVKEVEEETVLDGLSWF